MTRVAIVPDDGYRRRCSVCRKYVVLVPSRVGDAVCPECGSLNWLTPIVSTQGVASKAGSYRQFPHEDDVQDLTATATTGKTVTPFTFDSKREGWVLDLTRGPIGSGLLEVLLRRLNPIIEIDLSGTNVSDQCLSELEICQQLESLLLGETKISEDVLPTIASLRQLEYLSLANTFVTEPQLKQLAPLKNLRRLDLEGTEVIGRTFDSLACMQGIEWLYLGWTPLSDKSIPVLASLPCLKRLWVQKTKLSLHGLSELRRRLSDCEVTGS